MLNLAYTLFLFRVFVTITISRHLKLKPTIFLRYTLQLCEEEDSILQNEVSNLQTEISKSEKSLCHYVKRGLQNVFMRYWGEQFQLDKNGGKLRIFKKVKKRFEPEKYLFEITNFKHRQAVTKLRISAHKLTIETGRYNNTPYNDRLCRFCDLNEVGDEHHFLMSCKNIKLLSLRSKFFEDLYKINSSFKLFSSEELFMYIMAMKDESIMKLVAKFCFEVLTTFDSLLE